VVREGIDRKKGPIHWPSVQHIHCRTKRYLTPLQVQGGPTDRELGNTLVLVNGSVISTEAPSVVGEYSLLGARAIPRHSRATSSATAPAIGINAEALVAGSTTNRVVASSTGELSFPVVDTKVTPNHPFAVVSPRWQTCPWC
jgi:hypothetical protein